VFANVDPEVVAATVALALCAAADAALVDGIRKSAPNLMPKLGWLGPLYSLGIFWWRPAYRRFLKAGRFDPELTAHPKLLRLAQLEWFLWYLSLFVFLAVVLL
jgi:hypothetical protein